MKVRSKLLRLLLGREHDIDIIGLIERGVGSVTKGHHPQLQGSPADENRLFSVSAPSAIVTESVGEGGDWMG